MRRRQNEHGTDISRHTTRLFPSRKDTTFFLPDTEGINFHENVRPIVNEKIIEKHFPNSFRDTDLNEYLMSRGVRELVVCGMMSHMCIDATVRAASDIGYSCFVAQDACATKNLIFDGVDIPARHVHGAYMAALGAVYTNVLSAAEIIETLGKHSKEFSGSTTR